MFAAFLGACGCATGADDSDDGLCPQTSEFGNYGCTRVVALIRAPDGPLPLRMRVFLSIVPVNPNTGFSYASASVTAIDTMWPTLRHPGYEAFP